VPHSISRNGSDFEFFVRGPAISVPFRNFDRLQAPLVNQKMPDTAAASHGEQPQLPLASAFIPLQSVTRLDPKKNMQLL
jgi:hypothetical protein